MNKLMKNLKLKLYNFQFKNIKILPKKIVIISLLNIMNFFQTYNEMEM